MLSLQKPHPDAQLLQIPHITGSQGALERLRKALITDEQEAIAALTAQLSPEEHHDGRAALLSALKTPDAAARRGAMEAFATLGTAEDVEALIEACQRVRGLEAPLIATLSAIGSRRHFDRLTELLGRRLKWADEEAVAHYIDLHGEAALAEVMAALRTPFFPPARLGAARCLETVGMRSACFHLRELSLLDPSREVREACAQALHSLSGSSVTRDEVAGYRLIHAPLDDLSPAIERIRQAGLHALAGLRRTLREESWRRRAGACQALATLEGDEAEGYLVNAMTDVDEDVRLAAWQALQVRGWSPRLPREHTLVAFADRRLDRLLLTRSLLHSETLHGGLRLGGYLFRREVADALNHAAKDDDTASEVAATLAALDFQDVAESAEDRILLAYLHAADTSWQQTPHRALLAFSLRKVSATRLFKLTEDEQLGWRAWACACEVAGIQRATSAVDSLAPLVLDPDIDVRQAAQRALLRIGTPEAAHALASGARSPFLEDAEVAARALACLGATAHDTIQRLAHSAWWEERRAAALALLYHRQDRQFCVDHSLPLAVDLEYRVAEIARRALNVHGGRASESAIIATLKRAHPITIKGLEPWLDVSIDGHLRSETIGEALDEHFKALPPDEASQVLPLAGTFRRSSLAPFLNALATGETTEHEGMRHAAFEATRHLDATACRICEGSGITLCPNCLGKGEFPCTTCNGEGSLVRPCPEPDCNASEGARQIHAPVCKTCRGKGSITAPCTCLGGLLPCTMCHGSGMLLCHACDGIGETQT